MNLLLLGLFALALWLMFSLYRSHNRKKAELLLPVRSASIVKIHSYKSFGIIATIRFKEELTDKTEFILLFISTTRQQIWVEKDFIKMLFFSRRILQES